jgi:hypothetical protein
MALVTGKGARERMALGTYDALLKANSDVRSIVTEELLWHYVGHLLARAYRTTIQTVSGPTKGFIGCFENNRELFRKGIGRSPFPFSRNFETFRETLLKTLV